MLSRGSPPSSGAKRFPTASCAQPISLSLTEMAERAAPADSPRQHLRSSTPRRRTTFGGGNLAASREPAPL
jgi:hypothetical protein